MVQKTKTARKPSKKIFLQTATASEILAAHGITPAEMRRAKAIVASVERTMGRTAAPGRKRAVSGRVRSLPNAGTKNTATSK